MLPLGRELGFGWSDIIFLPTNHARWLMSFEELIVNVQDAKHVLESLENGLRRYRLILLCRGEAWCYRVRKFGCVWVELVGVP